MPNQRNPLNQLKPQQLLILALILGAYALYQYFGQQNNSPQPGGPAVPSLVFTIAPFEETPTDSAVVDEQTPTTQVSVLRQKTPTRTPSVTANKKASPTPTRKSVKQNFDYYVLSLSWSPDYCATSGKDDPQQCAVGKKLGFVLHGLWPQYNQGYPSNCSTQKLTKAIKDQFPNLYPSSSLYDHEWEKHGTCSGLDPASYLAFSKQVKESVNIPPAFQAPKQSFRTTTEQLKQQFVQANPGFDAADFELNCSSSGRYLQELYVCFTKDGQPRSCGADVHQDALRSCQAADFVVRNTR